MSEVRRAIPAPTETAGSGREHYGIELRPPRLPLIRDASSKGAIDPSRYLINGTCGHGCAANDVGVHLSVRALPPLLCDEAKPTSMSDDRLPMSEVADGLVVAMKAAAGYLWALWCHFRREREIAQSISLLAKLDDSTLRDIGIHRSEIAQVARYGLDETGRVRFPGS